MRRVAAVEAPLDERGVLGVDRALWRFQSGRLLGAPSITAQERRREEPDQDLASPNDAVCPRGGII